MSTSPLPSILCVDDEPNVLQGLVRQLRTRFQVTTAVGGAEGFRRLQVEGPFAVVVSDLRMPEMDGVTFLRKVREVAPETVRVLLTGQADIDAAIAAVNEGAIFRFLSKPCPGEVLIQALSDSVEQHHLLTSERVLLRETLQGSINILLDVLSLVQPTAFGRAVRIRRQVVELAASLGRADAWPLPIAAMLSQIGCVTLPAATAEKYYRGQKLTSREQDMVDRLPEVNARLVGSIPRLDPVRDILLFQGRNYDGSGPPVGEVRGDHIPWGARVLRIVLDFDILKAQGSSPDHALEVLRSRTGWYDPALLEKFVPLHAVCPLREERSLLLEEIQEGMAFNEDVRTRTGRLLIACGHEVTASLLERIRNLSPDIGIVEPIRVLVPLSSVQLAAANLKVL